MAVVPEEDHDLADNASPFDRAPEPAVAGDRPVVAHHVEVPARDVERVLPRGRRVSGARAGR